MTVKDLYEYCKEKGIEDYEIEIQYRDGGGYYSGTSTLYEHDIEINRRDEIVVL